MLELESILLTVVLATKISELLIAILYIASMNCNTMFLKTI